MTLLRDGQIIRGTYEVERYIGSGAFAEVYRVKHRFLGRQAMKVFKTVGMTMEETERALGEAIMLSRIDHPNIVRVFDANITDIPGAPSYGFFTMQYIAGGSLEQFWRSHANQFVPVETTVSIMSQVCRGLAVAHGEDPPIIHRDIKPQNLLIGYDKTGLNARVSDFGLAKQVNPLTLLASARGTRAFKAPESLEDPTVDSCAGDVWALGSTMYLLLTDRLPFSDVGDVGMVDKPRFDRPLVAPSRINIKVDSRLDEIVARALDLKPERRYRNAQALLQDLVSWKPRVAVGPNKSVPDFGSSEVSKSALGMPSPANQQQAQRMVTEAVTLAKGGRFTEAADLMEEAFNRDPTLRHRYEYKIKLWRRGVMM